MSINGIRTATVWAKPYTACLAQQLKPGINTIEVRVTNLWHNRLVADARLPVVQRMTKTNIAIPVEAKPLPSGLIGPLEWSIRLGP
jgi:hypothetical protein